MSTLKYDLYPILQEVADVPLGESFEPHADQVIALLRGRLLSDEAIRAMRERINREPDATIPEGLSLTVLGARDALTAALDAITGEQT